MIQRQSSLLVTVVALLTLLQNSRRTGRMQNGKLSIIYILFLLLGSIRSEKLAAYKTLALQVSVPFGLV